MTLVAVGFVDTRAAELGYALGLDPLPALRTCELTLAGRRVELRILGCSHQVLVRRGGAVELCETVACLSAGGAPLPGRHEAPGGYRFTSTVRALPADPRAALPPGCLLAAFPGHADAFTALHAHATVAGLRWESWHAYPQSRELVVTRSLLAAP